MISDDLKIFTTFAVLKNNGFTNGFKNIFFAGNKPNYTSENHSNNRFVFTSYDYKNEIEKLSNSKNSLLNFPLYFSFTPELKGELQTAIRPTKSTKIDLTCTSTKQEYIQKVNALKHHIQQGDIYEINYCITFEAFNTEINPFDVFNKLNTLSNAPYSALVKLNDKYIICASPELFLSKRGNKLITKPIKGTARRSSMIAEDTQIKNELLHSLKERTENVMIVDVARNDLSRIAQKGSVQVEKLYDIESYQQVHQRVSTVSCELRENTSFKEIIHATFPMASMTGAPKISALHLIDEYELYNRNAYSGALGYINANGNFDLNVLIRSIFYDEEKKHLSFTVGSAITSLCNAEEEYEECLLKAKAMMQVLS